MKRLLPSFAAAAALLATSPATAMGLPQKTVTTEVYGNETCPKAADGEIVVCARRPENERYRIPKALRQTRRTDAPSMSWAARWAGVENASRYTMPNSCSTVGAWGQTGCTQAMIRQWWLERQSGR
jgi:hypothetical protein